VEAEYKLGSANFRRESDPRRAVQPAIRVTGISHGWYGRSMEAVVKSLGASGTVTELMQKSQTHSERCHIGVDIHSKDCRRYLRVSRCTQAIRLPSTYDA